MTQTPEQTHYKSIARGVAVRVMHAHDGCRSDAQALATDIGEDVARLHEMLDAATAEALALNAAPLDLTSERVEAAIRAEEPEEQAKTLRWLRDIVEGLESELGLDDVEWCTSCGEPILDLAEATTDEDGWLCANCGGEDGG